MNVDPTQLILDNEGKLPMPQEAFPGHLAFRGEVILPDNFGAYDGLLHMKNEWSHFQVTEPEGDGREGMIRWDGLLEKVLEEDIFLKGFG